MWLWCEAVRLFFFFFFKETGLCKACVYLPCRCTSCTETLPLNTAGRKSARASVGRVAYLRGKPLGGAATSVWQPSLCVSRSVIGRASWPISSRQDLRKSPPRTRAACTQKKKSTEKQGCCASTVTLRSADMWSSGRWCRWGEIERTCLFNALVRLQRSCCSFEPVGIVHTCPCTELCHTFGLCFTAGKYLMLLRAWFRWLLIDRNGAFYCFVRYCPSAVVYIMLVVGYWRFTFKLEVIIRTYKEPLCIHRIYICL